MCTICFFIGCIRFGLCSLPSYVYSINSSSQKKKKKTKYMFCRGPLLTWPAVASLENGQKIQLPNLQDFRYDTWRCTPYHFYVLYDAPQFSNLDSHNSKDNFKNQKALLSLTLTGFRFSRFTFRWSVCDVCACHQVCVCVCWYLVSRSVFGTSETTSLRYSRE